MAVTWGRPDTANVGGRFHEGRVINTNARNTGMPALMEASNGDSTGQPASGGNGSSGDDTSGGGS